MAKKYVNVNLPEDVIKTIDRIINIKGLGYTSRAELRKRFSETIGFVLFSFEIHTS